jgi:hypothetical protein
VQGNKSRASRLRARGSGAEQEQRAGDATRCDGPAGGYAGVPAVFRQHTCMSRGGSAREQEDLEVRGGVGIANQSSPIVSSHKSTTPSSSYSSSIARTRPQHTSRKLLDPPPPHRASSNPFAETLSPWQSQPLSPQVTVRNIPPAILHPLQSPGKLLHLSRTGTSSPSSSSHRRSCSPREFTFCPFSSTTKATPRFALTH